MKKSPNQIDHVFQSHFERDEIPVVHKDQLWRRIAIRSQRKSRGLLFLLVLFLLTTGWIAYAQLRIVDPNNEPADSVQNFTSTIDAKLEELIETTAAIPKVENEDRKEIIAQVNQESKSHNLLKIPPTEASISADESILTDVNNRTTSANTGNTSTRNTSLGIDISNQENKTEQDLLNTNNKSIAHPKAIQDVESSKEGLVSNTSNLSAKAQRAVFQLPSIQLLSVTPLPYLLSPPAMSSNNGMMKKCIIGRSNMNPYVDIYGLFSKPLESVILSAGSDQTQYLTNWENRYNPLTSISAGISVGNEWANGIGVSVGFEYQRMESQYKTTQTVTEITTIFDPMAYFFYDVNDQIVWVGDSVTSITTYDRTVAIANTTTLLNLPVQLSYNLIQKGPWKIKATAGGIINLSLQYRGRYLQADQSLNLIDDTNQGGIVTPRLGIGIEGGVHFGYLFSQKWEVYFSPKYRYNKSSYWDNSQVIQLSRDYVGLRTGVKYHF